MSDHSAVIKEVRELWHGFIENELDLTQKLRLDTLIKDSDEALAEYIELMNMHNTLSNYLSAMTTPRKEVHGEDSNPKSSLDNMIALNRSDASKSNDKEKSPLLFNFLQSVPGSFSNNAFQIFVLLVFLLPSFFAFLAVMNSSKYNSLVIPAPEKGDNVATVQNPIGKRDTGRVAQQKPKAVALRKLVHPTNAVALISNVSSPDWGQELNGQLDVGTYLAEGERFTLFSGFAELEFPYQVRVVVQGPATFVTGTYGILWLESGRCVAHVPRKASGFTINANGSQIVDLGTEFGVEANAEMETDVYVFQGKVELSIPDALIHNSVELTKYEGVRSSAKTGKIVPVEIDTDRFTRRLNDPGVLAKLPPKNMSFEKPNLSIEKFTDPDGTLRSVPVAFWEMRDRKDLVSPDVGYLLWSSKLGPYAKSGVTDGNQACILTLRDGTKPGTEENKFTWIHRSLGLIQSQDVGNTLDLSVDCCARTPRIQENLKIKVAFANKASNCVCGPFVGTVGIVTGREAWGQSKIVNASLEITEEMIGRELFIVIRAEDESPGSGDDVCVIDNVKLEAR